MTSRERMVAAFEFTHPDQIPVVYHPSPAGLYVHGRKLLDLFREFPPDNPIAFDGLPEPPPGTVSPSGAYRELRRDLWGALREYRIFGIHGHPRQFPFENWEAAADYVFPAVAAANGPAFIEARRELTARKREYLVFAGGLSLLESMCSMQPMPVLLMDLHAREPGLLAFLDRMVAHMEARIEYHVALGTDVLMFGDDWGTQEGPLLAPAVFREIFYPRYAQLFAKIKSANRRIFFHSCGNLGPILEGLFELGIDGLWPQITFHDNDAFRTTCRERRVLMYLHPDRQRLVPRGTPDEIRDTIRRYTDLYHELGGGAMFYVEIENDAPWENVRALIESVHAYR